jgi:hypothetical protein
MNEPRTVGAGGVAKTNESEIPAKLKEFDAFCQGIKDIILQGTDKYAGAQKDKAETIDIIPKVLGAQGYTDFILGDLLKRIFRFKNQRRERDIFKMACWLYLLWKFELSQGELDK